MSLSFHRVIVCLCMAYFISQAAHGSNSESDVINQLKKIAHEHQQQKNSTHVFAIPPLHSATIETALKQTFPNVNAILNHDKSAMIATFPPSLHQPLHRFFNTFYTLIPTPVTIRLHLIETGTHSDTVVQLLNSQYESQASHGPLFIPSADHLFKAVQHLVEKGEATLISSPQLVINNNETATLTLGEKIPYLGITSTSTHTRQFLQHLQTGLSVTVTPVISDENTITCTLTLSLDNITMWKRINQQEYPVLATRHLQSTNALPNNTLSLIAHINETVTRENKSINPLIDKIPFLGKLFQSRSKTEESGLLLIFIEPTIETKKR